MKGSKVFFSEGKNQKTFMPAPASRAGHVPEQGSCEDIEVFCFSQGGLRLSSEKKILSYRVFS
jgi:hypothetical protein